MICFALRARGGLEHRLGREVSCRARGRPSCQLWFIVRCIKNSSQSPTLHRISFAVCYSHHTIADTLARTKCNQGPDIERFYSLREASGLLAGPRLLATPASHVLPITNPHEVGDGALVQGWGKRLKTRKLKRWEYCVKALSV
jgi:hypothetical protein